MNSARLMQEIESLPDAGQEQVADFVAFLKKKYVRTKQADALEFTEEELAELDRRWQDYETGAEAVIEVHELKDWIKHKYGV
ncbi:MAG: hypothetical protein DYG98_22700 [Haliscomenobacteraceae bacterium CHB4]|nr:hypothetical protein [Saprospiraceae bacterium]MCE7925870.1 hypothetical protein [Haliscomenobacteraceae bacterium CHB4]